MTRKQNLSELESAAKMREKENYKQVLFGSLKSGIKESQKQHVWKGIADLQLQHFD